MIRFTRMAGAVALLTGCIPAESPLGVPTSGAEREQYERHRANRQSYMFQGL